MPHTTGGLGIKAQDAIDKFIELWVTGARKILGSDPTENTVAPMPFYASGAGYWFSYNDVVSNTPPANYEWSYARVSWAVYTKDTPQDIHLDFDLAGIEDINKPSEWNNAVLEYWKKDKFDINPNIPYIVNEGIDWFGYFSSHDTANPSGIRGFIFDPNEPDVPYTRPNWLNSIWYNFDNTVHSTGNRCNIVDQMDYSSYPTNCQPISSGDLQLPRAKDAYWIDIMSTRGNTNNYYDNSRTHNTNNSYLTENNYNSYYNTYNVNLPDGTGFNIGVGPAGLAINVVPAIGVGTGVGIAPMVSFDDLLDILSPVVNDLNDNAGYDITVELHDLDWYLGYEDYGDFYIEPLHQYDKLPDAPTFDGTVDLGDYPRVIGESVNTYMGLLPAGISVLLSAVFIIAIILDNLRGRR